MAVLDVYIAEPPPLQTDVNGVVRVGGTRVTLDTVVSVYQQGANAEEIVLRYDALSLADVHAAISYYLRHRAEVDAYLRERQEQAEQVRQQNEAISPSAGIRERLLARRSQQEPIQC